MPPAAAADSIHRSPAAGAEEHTAETGIVGHITTDDPMEMIEFAVKSMPEQRRRVFCISRCEKRSCNDLAQALNIRPRRVQYPISGAGAELRKRLSVIAFYL